MSNLVTSQLLNAMDASLKLKAHHRKLVAYKDFMSFLGVDYELFRAAMQQLMTLYVLLRQKDKTYPLYTALIVARRGGRNHRPTGGFYTIAKELGLKFKSEDAFWKQERDHCFDTER